MDLLKIQPYPFIYNEKQYNGCMYSWQDFCRGCSKKYCFSCQGDEIHTCERGISYIRVSKEIVIGGIIVPSGPLSSAQKKSNKYARCIKFDELKHFIIKLKYAIEICNDKNLLVNNIPPKKKTRAKPEINFKFIFHDIKSIIATIIRNINVAVEMKNSESIPFEDKLKNYGDDREKAIYYASRMLEEKLSIFELAQDTDKVKDKYSYKKFRFHGLVYKYIKIYEALFSNKNLKINKREGSYRELYTNPIAISSILQNLLDNAYKYSPQDATIDLSIVENDMNITFMISSYGPKITDFQKIYECGHREESAQVLVQEGGGYGLYLSKKICDILGIKIEASQDTDCIGDCYYKTNFSIKIPFYLYAENILDNL